MPADRTAPRAAATSARVWPLSRWASTVALDDEEAPAVHGRDRAVTAVMLAAATGLDVAGQLEAAVSTLEVRVLLEARKERARWGREVELREDRSRRSARPDRSAIRGGLE